jgi:predicted nucleotidyltransferase
VGHGRISLPGGLVPERLVETAARHGAHNVRVFGSVARGTATEESDLDLLVDMEPGRDLFDLVALKREVEESLGRRVDVLTESSLSPYLREKVLREAVPL